MLLRTRWQKVVIDIRSNLGRTVIVAAAIAVGVYATGTVLNAREILVREYGNDQGDALMASAILHTLSFDDDLADRIAEVPGVAAAEGRREVLTLAFSAEGEPRDMAVVALPDFDAMGVDALTHMEGSSSPAKRQILLEHQSLSYLDLAVGDAVFVTLDSGAEKVLEVVGTVHDPLRISPSITRQATGYVSLETMGALGLDMSFDELHVRVAERTGDEAHIRSIIAAVEDQLERSGRPVFSRRIITESLADPFIDTVVLILTSLGLIILVLSGFLVVNALTALITQQVAQIGVMKLIGARRGQIMGLYVVTILVYSVLAVAAAVPLALLTSRLLMTAIVEPLLNIRSDSYHVPLWMITLQVGVGFILPLLAGLVPVIKGTMLTTNQALNGTAANSGSYGHGWVERALRGLQRLVVLNRLVLLAIRNSLRHKGRLVQTLIVLIVGTALFISVISVNASVNATLEDFMRFHGYDVSLGMERPYRMARLEAIAQEIPEVVAIEGWSIGGGTRLRPDGSESEGIRVYALPPDTALLDPVLSEGEWLDGSVPFGVVVNSDVLDDEPDLHVGSDLVLEIADREAAWRIVGTVATESRGPTIYMDIQDYGYITRTTGQVSHLQVTSLRHDAGSQQALESRLRDVLESSGLAVDTSLTTQVMRQENRLMFTIVVSFLILMALLLGVVGGLGLTTTMSINILERVREIGVLRAVGASNASVRRIVLAEGVIMGLLSWIVGTLMSLPISRFMSDQFGLALIGIPLTYRYSILAAGLWFVVLQSIAVVASLGPARNAVRLTIREVLAYE